MANALKCDRCGKYYDYVDGHDNYIIFGNKYIIVNQKKATTNDICPKCMEEFKQWYAKPEDCLRTVNEAECADRSNGSTEKEFELASKLNDAKIYIAQLKNELGYTMTKEEIEFMKDIHNFTDEDISEAAKFVETKSSEELAYKDPCKSCHNGKCEQCDYGYKSEEERKELYKKNKPAKLSDPYEEGGL